MFLDNFGWGEAGFNGGGIVRGAETPKLDQLAALLKKYPPVPTGALDPYQPPY